MSNIPDDDTANWVAPSRPYSLVITQTVDILSRGAGERVLHEEVLFAHDVSELAPIARNLLKVHGGDGFTIRRPEAELQA